MPGGRKPPLIPPSLLAAEKEKEKEREREKEKEKAKEEANAAAVTVKTEKEVDSKPVGGEEKSGDSKDKKPPAISPGKINGNFT